jgi:hypothetical protein
MAHYGSFRPAALEALFAQALSGLTSGLSRLRRSRLRPSEPSAAEAAAEEEAEARAVQVVLAMAWALMGAGCTEAAVGIIQARLSSTPPPRRGRPPANLEPRPLGRPGLPCPRL